MDKQGTEPDQLLGQGKTVSTQRMDTTPLG